MQNTENNTSKSSIQSSGVWQNFLNKQIGEAGKGKTVQELNLPTREWMENRNKTTNVVNSDSISKNNSNNIEVDHSEELPDTKSFIVEKRTKEKATLKEIKIL